MIVYKEVYKGSIIKIYKDVSRVRISEIDSINSFRNYHTVVVNIDDVLFHEYKGWISKDEHYIKAMIDKCKNHINNKQVNLWQIIKVRLTKLF